MSITFLQWSQKTSSSRWEKLSLFTFTSEEDWVSETSAWLTKTVCAHVHMYTSVVSQRTLGLGTVHLDYWVRVSHWCTTHHWLGWLPVCSRDSLLPAFPVLRLQAHATIPRFSFFNTKTWILELNPVPWAFKDALYWLIHLPKLRIWPLKAQVSR